MSFFSQALQDVLKQRDWQQKDACAAFDLTTATMSQYIGGSRNPAPKQLSQILNALTPPESAALLVATFRDAIPDDKFRDLVLLTDTTTSETLREEAREQWRSIPIPEDTMRHFETLMNAARTDASLRDLIASLASFVKPEPNEL